MLPLHRQVGEEMVLARLSALVMIVMVALVPTLGLNAGPSWMVAAVCSIAAIALVVRFAEEPAPIGVEVKIASPRTVHNWASAAAKSPTAAARLSTAVAALHCRACAFGRRA